MKTKEAIDWVEQYRYSIHSKTNGVIELLEEGKKYKSMWEELEESLVSKDKKAYRYQWTPNAIRLLDFIKQKYFPKPKFVKEIEKIAGDFFVEKIEKRFKKFIKELKEDY